MRILSGARSINYDLTCHCLLTAQESVRGDTHITSNMCTGVHISRQCTDITLTAVVFNSCSAQTCAISPDFSQLGLRPRRLSIWRYSASLSHYNCFIIQHIDNKSQFREKKNHCYQLISLYFKKQTYVV